MMRVRAAAERNTKTAMENNRRYCRMKLTMLGTGNALVTECYNTCFVIEDEG